MSKLKDYFKDKIIVNLSFVLSIDEILALKTKNFGNFNKATFLLIEKGLIDNAYQITPVGKEIIKQYEANVALNELIEHSEDIELYTE